VSLDPTSVPAKQHLNPSNGLSEVQECDRRQTTDSRQTRYRKNAYKQMDTLGRKRQKSTNFMT